MDAVVGENENPHGLAQQLYLEQSPHRKYDVSLDTGR